MWFGAIILYNYNGTFWSCGTLNIWSLLSDILFGGKGLFNVPNTLNGPIWYIGILMFCYFVAYFLSKFCNKHHSLIPFTFPIIIGIEIMYSHVDFAFWNGNVARGFVSFFLGILIGEFLKSSYFTKISEKNRLILKEICLIQTIVFLILAFSKNSKMFIGNMYLSYSFLFFTPLIILLYDNHFINKICSCKIITWLGNISFGMYLWNFPIMICFHLLFIMNMMPFSVISKKFILLNLIIHIIVGSLSYILIDKKLCKLLTNKLEKI